MLGFLAYLGRWLIGLLEHLTSIVYLLGYTVYYGIVEPLRGKPFRWARVFDEFEEFGQNSLFIVIVTSTAIGIIIIFLLASWIKPLGASTFIPGTVAKAIIKLLPLLIALVLAGRIGASITAKLGTMRISEEILALEVMAINPISYLVVPRFIAAIVMIPALTIIGISVGLVSASIMGIVTMDFDPGFYRKYTIEALTRADILQAFIKSLVFSLTIVTIGTYQGLTVEGGAQGVGRATMTSVMTSTMLIILAEAVMTAIFYQL